MKFVNVLNQLPELGLPFNEIVFKIDTQADDVLTMFANPALRAFGASAKYLKLPQISSGMCNLSNFNHWDLWSQSSHRSRSFGALALS